MKFIDKLKLRIKTRKLVRIAKKRGLIRKYKDAVKDIQFKQYELTPAEVDYYLNELKKKNK